MKRSTKVLIGIAALGMGWIAAFAVQRDRDRVTDRLAQARDAVAHADGLELLTPGAIVAAYRSNPISADQRYAGRAIRLRGVIDHVSQAGDGTAIVWLRENEETGNVACWWDDRSEIVQLGRGDMIIARGYGAPATNGVPTLVVCKLEKREW